MKSVYVTVIPPSLMVSEICRQTSAKGMVRLNKSQRSIIFTYEVFGSAFDTLMNLERKIAVNMRTLFC